MGRDEARACAIASRVLHSAASNDRNGGGDGGGDDGSGDALSTTAVAGVAAVAARWA